STTTTGTSAGVTSVPAGAPSGNAWSVTTHHPSPSSAGSRRRPHDRHQHLGGGERTVAAAEADLAGVGRVEEGDGVAGGQHDVAQPTLDLGLEAAAEPALGHDVLAG